MRHSSPLLQGALDGLCGPYAIVNAVNYLEPLDDDGQAALFRSVMRAISKLSVLWSGTTTDQVADMLGAAQAFLGDRHRISIAFSRPFAHRAFNGDFAAFFDELAALVDRPHCAAIIGLSKPYEHWTDATYLSGARIALRDSVGLHFIDKANCGLHGADKPFAIDHRQAFLIERTGK